MKALVIGGGPAGLMAAECLAQAGMYVELIDQKPSFGRKLLMAGKSGLNLTKQVPHDKFIAAYQACSPEFRRAINNFGPAEVIAWAESLGQDVFTGSTGRVFPVAMKASPLLRAWLNRLRELGVTFSPGVAWRGWDGDDILVDGRAPMRPDVTILALGGGSWTKLGSDGAWRKTFDHAGIKTKPFSPANAALWIDWSAPMTRHFGAPLKAVCWRAGNMVSRGETTLTAKGIEGGGIYPLTSALRESAALTLDLCPDRTIENVASRLGRPRRKLSQSNWLRKALGLSPQAIALLREFGGDLTNEKQLSNNIKNLPIIYRGVRPLDEAISTAGGLPFNALDGWMLRERPGVFACGEMLDWDAPTGGYLLTGCLASGRAAAKQALAYTGLA